MSLYFLTILDMSHSHELLSITVLNTVYAYKYFFCIKKIHFKRLSFPSPILTVTPLFPVFPPLYYRYVARSGTSGNTPF